MKGSLIGEGGTARIHEWGPGRVVKVFTPDYAYTADMEFDRTRAVHAAGVRCPEPVERTRVDGREAIVFERVDGPTLLEKGGPDMPLRLAELHAEVHAHTSADLPTRAEAIEPYRARVPADYIEAQERRAARMPEGNAICHALFHPGHVVLSEDGPRIIDWPDAFSGPAALDVARTAMYFCFLGVSRDPKRRAREAGVRQALSDAYLTRYGSRTDVTAGDVDRCRPSVAASLLFAQPDHPDRDRLRAIADA